MSPTDVAGPRHHPAIYAHRPITSLEPAEFDVDFLGTRTRRSFYAGMTSDEAPARGERVITTWYPAFDEEYFEWIDLLETIEQASDSYVIIELGAGYGRWCMRAASAVRRKPGCRLQCVAVEAEPDHFRWLLEHFRDNGVDPSAHEVIWAAAAARPGFAPFRIGKASGWYGQRIASRAQAPPQPGVAERRRLKARSLLARPPRMSGSDVGVMWVPCITLAEVLAPYPRVDLIDLDVQGAEADVLAAAIDSLTERVRRIHVGTHGAEVEQRLRELFSAHGWTNLHDYPCQQRALTPYGEIAFLDGVQTWVNPELGRSVSRSRARTIERLQKRNRALKAEKAALRARCRVLEERIVRLKLSRPWPLSLVSRWLNRWRARR